MCHRSDVLIGMIASQITSLTIVYSTVYSVTDQRKHQSSTSLAFVWGINRWPLNSLHKWPVMRKMFHFDYLIKCWFFYFCNYLSVWIISPSILLIKYSQTVFKGLIMDRCVLLTLTPECVVSPCRAITRAQPEWLPHSNRNASKDESVETGDEFVKTGDESIEAAEKNNNHVINRHKNVLSVLKKNCIIIYSWLDGIKVNQIQDPYLNRTRNTVYQTCFKYHYKQNCTE